MAGKKKLNFEQAMMRLEEIVTTLERGEASLEDSMKLFEEGSKLMRVCTSVLEEAEQKVTLLTANEDGTPQETPFQGEI